ncbi:MAG: SIR2 family protein [Solirubrobacteraceae bacterium]
MHDPHAFANSLSAKLATRSRHVCVLLGAGVGRACGLPDVAGLQDEILGALSPVQKPLLESQLVVGNIEQALSRLRRIAGLLNGEDETVGGLTAQAAKDLDTAICAQIVACLDVQQADHAPALHFASWAGRAEYHLPLEIFTVNYDLLIETALEKLGIAYFDGFVGALRARFRTDLVEATPSDADEWLPSFLVRLWKLHGSVNWEWDPDGRKDVTRLGSSVEAGKVAAIYPSDTKYDESRRVPFVVLQDRFRRALYTPESLILAIGYSWHDEHLNELLIEAARRRPRSEIITFTRSKLPDAITANATSLPNLQAVTAREAILGGVQASWDAPEDPLPGVWREDSFALADFQHLAAFLAQNSSPQPDIDQRLKILLETLGGDD